MRPNSRLTGLRKGAWTEEEDALLRTAIDKYGEGKWHKVPARAGLNRCRKSCRLRWLNYLRPNIKRGDFSADEIDLIIRLHKLLGNRWSLIAGRLPGRTANDVKNYWNTHLFKKMVAGKYPGSKHLRRAKNVTKPQIPTSSMKDIVVKPKPMSFSDRVNWMNKKENEIAGAGAPVVEEVFPPPAPVEFRKESCSSASNSMQFWWDTLLSADSDGQPKGGACFSPAPDGDILRLSPAGGGGVSEPQGGGAGDPCSSFFPLDSEFWDLLNSDD